MEVCETSTNWWRLLQRPSRPFRAVRFGRSYGKCTHIYFDSAMTFSELIQDEAEGAFDLVTNWNLW